MPLFQHLLKPILIVNAFNLEGMRRVRTGAVAGMLVREKFDPEIKRAIDQLNPQDYKSLSCEFYRITTKGPRPQKICRDVFPEPITTLIELDKARMEQAHIYVESVMLNVSDSLRIKWHIDPLIRLNHAWAHRQLSAVDADNGGMQIYNPLVEVPVNDIGLNKIQVPNQEIKNIVDGDNPSCVETMQQGNVIYFNHHCAHVSAQNLNDRSMRYTMI